ARIDDRALGRRTVHLVDPTVHELQWRQHRIDAGQEPGFIAVDRAVGAVLHQVVALGDDDLLAVRRDRSDAAGDDAVAELQGAEVAEVAAGHATLIGEESDVVEPGGRDVADGAAGVHRDVAAEGGVDDGEVAAVEDRSAVVRRPVAEESAARDARGAFTADRDVVKTAPRAAAPAPAGVVVADG